MGYPGETEIKLLYTFTENYTTTIFDDTKQFDLVVKQLVGNSPSDIKNIVHNSIASCIVNNKKKAWNNRTINWYLSI